MDRELSLSNTSLASNATDASNVLSEISDVQDDDLLAQSPMGSPTRLGLGGGGGGTVGRSAGGAAKARSGRMSVAGGELGGSRLGQSLTLREQEKVPSPRRCRLARRSARSLTALPAFRSPSPAPTTPQALDQKDREIFDLKLKLHFLSLRLDQSSPQTHAALEDENMQLKVAYGRLKAECKKNKKYSLECVKVIEELKRELERARAAAAAGGAGGAAGQRAREAELGEKVREEKERRRALEEDVERLRERADKEARQLRDSEVRSPFSLSPFRALGCLSEELDPLTRCFHSARRTRLPGSRRPTPRSSRRTRLSTTMPRRLRTSSGKPRTSSTGARPTAAWPAPAGRPGCRRPRSTSFAGEPRISRTCVLTPPPSRPYSGSHPGSRALALTTLSFVLRARGDAGPRGSPHAA